MIKNYSDHSANERTYLAWIRTSVAIMAFGFLIEKFDLFIAYIGKSLGEQQALHPSVLAELVSLGLFIVGILIIIVSTVRFFNYKSQIESDQLNIISAKKTNLFLSILMALLAIMLFFYLLNQIIKWYV